MRLWLLCVVFVLFVWVVVCCFVLFGCVRWLCCSLLLYVRYFLSFRFLVVCVGAGCGVGVVAFVLWCGVVWCGVVLCSVLLLLFGFDLR